MLDLGDAMFASGDVTFDCGDSVATILDQINASEIKMNRNTKLFIYFLVGL